MCALLSGQMEQLGEVLLIQLGADHTEPAGHIRAAPANLDLPRDIVEIHPLAIRGGQDALCTQHDAIADCIGQRLQCKPQLRLGVLARGLHAPAGKDLIRVMVMMVVSLVIVVMVTAALRIIALTILMVMVMPMVVMVPVLDRKRVA